MTKKNNGVFGFLLIVFLLLPTFAFAQKVLAVSDFTTSDFALEPQMRGLADVARAEFAKSNLVRIVDRSNFEDVFNELSRQRMGFTDAATVKRIGGMLNADYLVVGSVTRQGNAESLDVFGTGITVSIVMQMIDVQTGQVVSSETMRPASMNQYSTAMPATVRNMINRMPKQAEATFGGKWEASIEHDNIEDLYEIDFRPNGKCAVTVSSFDADNNETAQTAEGTYSLSSDGSVLNVNVNFRRSSTTLPHLTRIEWKTVFSLNNDRNGFSVVIPESSKQGAKRVRVTFQRK